MVKHICALAVAGVLLFCPAFAEEWLSVSSSTLALSPAGSPAAVHGPAIRALLDQGKINEAMGIARKWTSEEKKSDRPWVFLAEAYFLKKQYKKAISVAGKALERNAESGEAYYWRGQSYEAQKNWLDAANEYQAAQMADPYLAVATEGLSRVKSNLSLPQLDARQTGSNRNP